MSILLLLIEVTTYPRYEMARPVIKERAFCDRRLRAVDEYLRAHLSNPERLSLGDAARIANVSREHFCRMFHERVGASFIDWQSVVRTERAKFAIVEGSKPLSVVGRTVGYSDESTFGRVFRRYEGVTPRHIRPFVDAHPDLAPVVCSCTAELVFRVGPPCLRNEQMLKLLLRMAEHLVRR